MQRIFLISLFWIFFCITAPPRAVEIGEEVQSVLSDSEESREIFKKESRFVAVPNPISNPTIGFGLALTGLYLHPQREGGRVSPITISGIMGMYTDTNSWGVGIFQDGYYAQDKYRLR